MCPKIVYSFQQFQIFARMVTAPLAAVDSVSDLKGPGEGGKSINNSIDRLQPL